MAATLSDISSDAWTTVVDRLNGAGVFADEERKLPSFPALADAFTDFNSTIRSMGYNGGNLEIGEIDRPDDGVSFLIFDERKLADVGSAKMAWNQDYRNRWHERVDERVSNWLTRLDALKTMMQGWLPSGMSIVDRPSITMHEDMMVKFGIPPANMPTFDVFEGSKRIMRVQPKGLWIVGANGRVDLITPIASYILVDKSNGLSATSDWHYYASRNNRDSTQLNEATFVSLLR